MNFLPRSVCCLGLCLMCRTASALPAGLGPLTFADEFDPVAGQNILDLSKWAYRGAGDRNDGYVTPDAVSVNNGMLRIQTYTGTLPGLGTKNFTGMIATQNHFEQTYGYFEVRAKFHTTSGQWSAFWLQSPTMGQPVGNPEAAGVEMDIFEHRMQNSFDYFNYPGLTPTTDISSRINQALIWDGYTPGVSQSRVQLSAGLSGLTNDSWHTFGLKWGPESYTFYYDDVAMPWDGGGAPISRRSQYIILSSEVGRFFAGEIPEGGYGTKEASTTDFLVDYVRVYAIPEPATSSVFALAALLAGLGRGPRRTSTPRAALLLPVSSS